jgi:hypothetical protein
MYWTHMVRSQTISTHAKDYGFYNGYKSMLDWYRLLFYFIFNTIWESGMRISYFLTNMGMDVWRYSCFRYHSDLYTMSKFSYLGKITLVSIWIEMVLTQITSSDIQRFSYFVIPTKYQYLTGNTILIPLGRFFGNTIDVDFWIHAFTYTGPTLVQTLSFTDLEWTECTNPKIQSNERMCMNR